MDLSELWQAVLGELEVEQTKASFKTWFKATQLLAAQDGQVVVGVPTTFAKEWLEKNFHKNLKDILSRHLGIIKDIQYRVGHLPKKEPQLFNHSPTGVLGRRDAPRARSGDERLNKDYTFDSFVVGQSNRLAHATAKAVAEKPGQIHNPLFVYGGVGLGKTHLIHAIGNLVSSLYPHHQILYVSCEDFANEFIQSIQRKQMEPFKKKYRSVDVFLVDDIQFLSRKEGTQEEFFHTFNTLYQRRAQIVMTSDRLPRAIPDLEVRLSSRLGGGIIVDVSPPNLELRIAILKSKCQDKTIKIPDRVFGYIAERVATNIRDLEGSLNRLIAYCDLQQVEPTEQIATTVLESLLQTQHQPTANPERLINVICHYFGIRLEDLMSSKRNRELVYPRQITMYLMRNELSLSYPTIGKLLGGKDHTTIMHGFDSINSQLSRNEQLKTDVNILKEKLTSVV